MVPSAAPGGPGWGGTTISLCRWGAGAERLITMRRASLPPKHVGTLHTPPRGAGPPLPCAPLTVAWRRKAARAEPAPELGGLRIRGLGMGRQAGCLWQWAWTRIRGSGSPRVPTCDITAGQASARGGSSAYGLRAAAGTSARDARARGPHGCEPPRAAGAPRVPRGTAGFHPSAGDRAAGSPAFLPCSLGAGWAARPCVTPSAIPILPALGVPAAPGGRAGARGAPPLASHGEGPGWPAPHR